MILVLEDIRTELKSFSIKQNLFFINGLLYTNICNETVKITLILLVPDYPVLFKFIFRKGFCN